MTAVAILLADDFWFGRSGISENAYEFIHRPFVWTYWLVGSLTAGRLFSMVAERCLRFATAIVIVSIVSLNAGSSAVWLGATAQESGRERRRIPACAWIAAWSSVRITSGASLLPTQSRRIRVWTSFLSWVD